MALPTINPFWTPQPQRWLRDQERQHADEAVYSHGEWVMLTLMWTLADHEAGRVDRCSVCWGAKGDVAEAYGQGGNSRCPACWGTTFEGGIRAQVVRPAIVSDETAQQSEEERRGVYERSATRFQTFADLVIHKGDYIFRQDGSRWQIQDMTEARLRGNFSADADYDTKIATTGSLTLEARNALAYSIIPSVEETTTILTNPQTHFPVDFTLVEIINGPLQPLRVFTTVPGQEAPTQWVITAIRGDTLNAEIKLWESEEESYDVTGYTWLSQIRRSGDLVATFDVEVMEATEGLIHLSLTPAQTTDLPRMARYDLQGTSPDGDVTTFISGYITVREDVSQ